MTQQTYEWVTIQTEADLPKEEGDYTVRVLFKDGSTQVHKIGWMPGWDWHNEDGCITAYLRPIPVTSEKVSAEDNLIGWVTVNEEKSNRPTFTGFYTAVLRSKYGDIWSEVIEWLPGWSLRNSFTEVLSYRPYASQLPTLQGQWVWREVLTSERKPLVEDEYGIVSGKGIAPTRAVFVPADGKWYRTSKGEKVDVTFLAVYWLEHIYIPTPQEAGEIAGNGYDAGVNWQSDEESVKVKNGVRLNLYPSKTDYLQSLNK